MQFRVLGQRKSPTLAQESVTGYSGTDYSATIAQFVNNVNNATIFEQAGLVQKCLLDLDSDMVSLGWHR